MIVKRSIQANLRELDRAYRSATRPKDALFFSKLAILELCGWIEESMDDIVLRCSTRHLSDSANVRYCEKAIVRKTYGFDYDANFRWMLIRLVGLINVEALEKALDPVKISALSGALATLKQQRNTEAHTHIKGLTKTINAPSVTLAQLAPVYEGLLEIDRRMRKLKL